MRQPRSVFGFLRPLHSYQVPIGNKATDGQDIQLAGYPALVLGNDAKVESEYACRPDTTYLTKYPAEKFPAGYEYATSDIRKARYPTQLNLKYGGPHT